MAVSSQAGSRGAAIWDRASLEALSLDVARGVRAAFVTLVPFYLAAVLHTPALSWTAIGGWLGTLADAGGPRSNRARALIVFGLGGAAVVACAEPLAASPWLATPALALVAFSMSVLRASGGTAGTIGTFLTFVAAIATGRFSGHSIRDALYFALGAGLALFVSSIVWPVWMHLPVRRAVATVYEELGDYVEALAHACVAPSSKADDWTALVRDHHRRIRAAIEGARDTALAARARRMGETRFGGDIRALLGTAEAQFPLLSALALELESLDPAARAAASSRLRPLIASCREVQRLLALPDVRRRTRPPFDRPTSAPAISESVVDTLEDRLGRACNVALDLVYGLSEGNRDTGSARAPRAGSIPPLSLRPREGARPSARASVRAIVVSPLRTLRDALSPSSSFFKHALRTAIAAALASIVGARLSPTRAYWVTLTTIAVLQPYPGATFKRAGERVAGTVLGSLAALGVMMAVRSPLALSLLMIPLSIAAVATRPRSYRLFTFFLTPVFVLLAERYTGDWWAAAVRAGDALLGGAVALLVGVLVIPSSEKGRLPEALEAVFENLGAYATTVLETLGVAFVAARDERVMMARRASGLALGEAEMLLERYLAEPLHDRANAATMMLLATYARRLGAAITSVDTVALQLPLVTRQAHDESFRATARYVAGVLRETKAFVRSPTARTMAPAPPRFAPEPDAPIADALDRLLRWAALVASVGTDDPSAA